MDVQEKEGNAGGNCGGGCWPELDLDAPPVPKGDYVTQEQKDAGMYYVSVDPAGRLGWEANQITSHILTPQHR